MSKCRTTVFWIFAALILANYTSHADPATDNDSLPTALPADFLDTQGFMPFTELPDDVARELRKGKNYAPAPIGSGFYFDDVKVGDGDRDALHKVFEETVFAMIPTGTKIKSSMNSDGKEVWDYPIGTSAVHRIRFKSDPPALFEIRLVRKLNNGKWAFGSYSLTGDDAGTLALNTYTSLPKVTYQVKVAGTPTDAPPTKVQFFRVNLVTCQSCHYMNSTGFYQYSVAGADGKTDLHASFAVTGPCGFVPTNPSIKDSWAKAVLDKNGNSPFDDE